MSTQYMIADASTNEKLVEKVQAKINEGWSVQGGVSVTLAVKPMFAQALTKKA